MIARINLLPWREEYRQQKKIEFFQLIGAAVVVGALTVGLWDRVVNAQIDNQMARNALLESKIAELNDKVKEIAELKARRQAMLDRMTVIQALQANRPDVVRVFDEITMAIPEGVFLKELSRSGTQISLSGYAESNNRVSSLMRNLEQSYKFKEPVLTNVKADDLLDEQGNTFDMRVSIKEPKVVEDTAEEESGEGA